MSLFTCPHCEDLVELLGDSRIAPQCDCGGLMEPLHLSEQLGPALDLSDPAQRDQAIRVMLAGEAEPPMPSQSGVQTGVNTLPGMSPREAR